MNNKLKPALIGGVVFGLLSVIPFVGACCCAWAILGGILATYLYVKKSPTLVTSGEGIQLGALAGLVGVAIFLVIGIPVDILMGPIMKDLMVKAIENLDPRQAELMRRQFEVAGTSIAQVIITNLILAVLLFIFSMIGGVIGVPLFEKRKGGTPPAPPINVGGGPGGYAA
jgi:hypothetical protein